MSRGAWIVFALAVMALIALAAYELEQEYQSVAADVGSVGSSIGNVFGSLGSSIKSELNGALDATSIGDESISDWFEDLAEQLGLGTA